MLIFRLMILFLPHFFVSVQCCSSVFPLWQKFSVLPPVSLRHTSQISSLSQLVISHTSEPKIPVDFVMLTPSN